MLSVDALVSCLKNKGLDELSGTVIPEFGLQPAPTGPVSVRISPHRHRGVERLEPTHAEATCASGVAPVTHLFQRGERSSKGESHSKLASKQVHPAPGYLLSSTKST